MSEFVEEPYVPPSLTPESDEPIDPNLLLRQTEEDIDVVDDGATADLVISEERPPIGRGWAFQTDPLHPGLVRSVTGGVLPTNGLDTLKVWIRKCMHTERGAFPIYSEDYGMVRPFDLIGQPGTETGVADYEDRLRDALLKHPRITALRDFDADFALSSSDGEVSFSVVTDTDDVLEIQERVRL